MFKKVKKSYKVPFISKNTWREIFLISGNTIYKSKEKISNDRSSSIPFLYSGLLIKIHKGNFFHRKKITNYMVGHKLGEFS